MMQSFRSLPEWNEHSSWVYLLWPTCSYSLSWSRQSIHEILRDTFPSSIAGTSNGYNSPPGFYDSAFNLLAQHAPWDKLGHFLGWCASSRTFFLSSRLSHPLSSIARWLTISPRINLSMISTNYGSSFCEVPTWSIRVGLSSRDAN